ncbi:MAG: AraC family transcriptional regulator [Woeseiaceae bacterium]|nr:AraC family transcriptional regulator [Woeseiaceae bacterium]
MIILTEPPPCGADLTGLYTRLPIEGMVFSSSMCGESYDPVGSYDDAWSCPAVAWSLGGRETYLLENGEVIELENTGAMTIAAGDRYAYRAGDTPFLSNMIVFPRSVTELAEYRDVTLQTRLIRSDRRTEALLRSISESCRTQSKGKRWYHEKIVALYRRLAKTQQEIDDASQLVAARKTKTQEILTARVDRAQQYILKNFHNPEISLADVARAACLSPYHLIRIFKAVTGRAPMQYLQATRMIAALRLLQESDHSVAEIARSVGYSDRTAFARSFHRHHGVAPSSVRDRCSRCSPSNGV